MGTNSDSKSSAKHKASKDSPQHHKDDDAGFVSIFEQSRGIGDEEKNDHKETLSDQELEESKPHPSGLDKNDANDNRDRVDHSKTTKHDKDHIPTIEPYESSSTATVSPSPPHRETNVVQPQILNGGVSLPPRPGSNIRPTASFENQPKTDSTYITPASGPAWLRSAHYQSAPNPGIQPLRTSQAAVPQYPTGPSVSGPPNILSPHNPYAFLNEQTLPLNSGGRKRTAIIVSLIVMALLLLGVASVALLGGNKSGQQTGTETGAPEGLSISFSMIQPQYKDEVITGAINQQITGSDGAVIMVAGVDRNYTAGGVAASSGGELVKIDLLVGNADSSKPMIFDAESFIVLSLKGATAFPKSGSDVGAESVTLNPGMKGKLSVVYELGADMGEILLLHNRSYQDAGIRYTMLSSVGLSSGTSSLTVEDVMRILQSAKPQ